MELTSTLICPQCTLYSASETTCSNCGASLSPHSLESSTDIASSTDLDLADTNGESPIQEDSDLGFSDDHNNHPPASEPPRTSGSSSINKYHPIFWGQGQTLFGIFIVNTLYTLLTLGIYSFWGRVRIRQYLSSQTSLAKIRFSYHGTGMELLKGSLKALVIFGIPYIFLSFVPIIWEQIPSWIPNALAGLMVIFFIPVAVVGAQRYRLSRTAFGAIRFSFRGQVKTYRKIWFTGTFLTFMTAGVYYPFFENTRREFLTSRTYLGNRHFSYGGAGMDLLKIYGKALVLIAVTALVTSLSLIGFSGIDFGPDFQSSLTVWLLEENQKPWLLTSLFINVAAVMWAWFYLQAAKQRYFWNHSTFGNAPFQFRASTWNLIELRVTNFLMLVLTFGLAWSWVQVRNLQFLYYHLELSGPLDIHQIEQEALDASPTGEELAGYFDAGFDLG